MRWQRTFNNPISATVLLGENSPNYAVPRSKKDVSYHVVFDDWWNDVDLWITQNWISTKLLISKPTALYAGVRLDFEIRIIYSVTEIRWEIKKSWTFVVTSSEFLTQKFTFIDPQFKNRSQSLIELFSNDLSRHFPNLKLIFILFRPYNPIEFKFVWD